MIDGAGRPSPGHIYYDTVKEKGFSLKVFSTKGAARHISLLNISGGRAVVNFQSTENIVTASVTKIYLWSNVGLIS